ncbi:hypothetical protein NPX79_00245 [Spiroplasma endosymbiont of Anurida maritima]|uniref:hypothetical protein n=1 Tax=Spiroplasma endosymbiont of Anurida maritima TaxID=2967972 RepID=UPI0036D2F449
MKKLEKNKTKFKLSSLLTILFFITAIIIFLSWIPGLTENGPASIVQVISAPIEGFVLQADRFVFLFIASGFIFVVIKSETFERSLGQLFYKFKNKEIWLIPILVTVFSIFGSFLGFGENVLIFYAFLIPIFLNLKFDVMVGAMIIFFGFTIGVISSTFNTFAIKAAVDAALENGVNDISIIHGIIIRFCSLILLNLTVSIFIILYALKIKKNPKSSTFYNEQSLFLANFPLIDKEPYTKRHKIILIIFFISLMSIILGMIPWDFIFNNNFFLNIHKTLLKEMPYLLTIFNQFGNWSYIEFSAILLISSIIIGVININNNNMDFNNFLQGTKNIINIVFVIALSTGIGLIMSDKYTGMGSVIVASVLKNTENANNSLYIIVNFFTFIFLSFLIPTTSGFISGFFPTIAKLTNEIAPEMVSGTITSFSFANGIASLFSPTSAVLLSTLSISKITYKNFIKSTWKLTISIFIICFLLLILGSGIKTSTFLWF